MIPRLIQAPIFDRLTELRKAIVLLGPRQVGKTTLLLSIKTRIEAEGRRVRYLNCDLEEERQAADTTSRILLDRLASGVDAVFIDEAQRLENPGLTIKILVDQYPDLMVLVTGSSGFELRNRISDAMTGRYLDFHMYPISMIEVLEYQGIATDSALSGPTARALLPDVLLYGLYPEIYLQPNPSIKQDLLTSIADSYLFKDILAFQRIRYSQKIVDLARALAYQIGAEVNESELANRLKIDRKTILSYMDILEKSFVILRLPAFSRNPRREIGRQSKVYFLDNGIRNALIGDFNNLSVRQDRGALWENFLIVERYKSYLNRGRPVQGRFWRTYGGAEVDYIEADSPEPLRAFEFKFDSPNPGRGAEAFTREYGAAVRLVNQSDFLDFLRGD